MQINIQPIEILGVIATILLIISMSFSCKDTKSTIKMRIVNALANLLFLIYSFIIGAYSMMMANAFIIGLDVGYIEKAYKSIKNGEKNNEQ